MRKNKDYSDIENTLFDKANRLESGIDYSGAYRDSKNEKRVKREKSGRGFDFPGRQLVAALLAMVIVGAGTFAGLKYLERLGAKRLAEQGGAPGTSQGEQIAENVSDTDHNRSGADDISGVETIEYDPSKENGEGLVYVTSGDKVYQPFICEQNRMALIDYEPPKFAYSGRMNIVNNVKDREWTVLSTNIWFPGIQSYDSIFDNMDLKLICSLIDRHESGTYRVTFKVTWDDPDDENAKIYYVDFYVEKSMESAVFEDVVKFDIDYTDYDVPQVSELPSDVTHIRIFGKLKCEAAEALGYSVCLYDAAPVEVSMSYLTPCILDENGEIMFDFQQSSDVWYAGKTPTGHPTFFYVKRHALTSNGWTYADLYAYDTVNKEETLVISVGPKGLHSQSNLRVFGDISYDEETKELKISFYEDKTNIWNPEDKATWPKPFATEPIKWNGEKYVVEGIDATRLSEESRNENKTEEEIKREQLKAKTEEEATGRLHVIINGVEFKPGLMSAEISEDNKAYQFEYKNDLPIIEYDEPFEIRNGIRTRWTIQSISAGRAGFEDIDGLTDYLHKVSGSVYKVTYLEVNISVSWNNDNIYHYGFTLKFKANDVTQKTDVTPSGYAKFILAAGEAAIAPFEYSEWSLNERDRVNVTYNPVPDTVPVLNLYGLGEYGALFCSYDNSAVEHYETHFNYLNGGTLIYNSPWGFVSDAKSLFSDPKESNVEYIETIFKKKDGSERYISYIYAVSGGEPDCYPYTDNGDGAAKLKVSDGKNEFAPRAEKFYCSDYSNISSTCFTRVNLPYYKVPELSLEKGLTFELKAGQKIGCIIAFQTADTWAKYERFDGDTKDVTEWLRSLPWDEFYVSAVIEGEEKENAHQTGYVIKVKNAGAPQAIDHSAQVEELNDWLSQRMQYGMNEEDLLNMAIEEKSLKPAILAGAPDQINHEDDGTFVRYETESCDFLYFSKKDTHITTEVRMILHPGTNFALPFGITLDMSPEQVLNALGYTEEQIAAMDGYASSGNYQLRYDERFLRVSYHCNGVYLGIEIGPEPQMYMETAE